MERYASFATLWFLFLLLVLSSIGVDGLHCHVSIRFDTHSRACRIRISYLHLIFIFLSYHLFDGRQAAVDEITLLKKIVLSFLFRKIFFPSREFYCRKQYNKMCYVS